MKLKTDDNLETIWRTPVARFIAKIREKHGLTFRQIGKIADVSPSVVHEWANGGYPCETIGRFKKLCDHFGESFTFAMTGEFDETMVDAKQV